MKFKYPCLTQTQIGKLFGVTSHVIGHWLKSLGLRDEDGKPTDKAYDGKVCESANLDNGRYHWTWHAQKTVAALLEAGNHLVPNPPAYLIEPAILNGPFSVRQSATAEFVVENGDGSACVWANNRMTADVVARILNTAYKLGVIDRLCAHQRVLTTPLAPFAEIDSVVQPFRDMNEPPSLVTAPQSAIQTVSATAPDTTVLFDGNSTLP